MGENLFYSRELYSWDDVISAWHSEVSHFKYPNMSTSGLHTGHYTQVTESMNASTKIMDVLSHSLEVNHEVTISTQCRNKKKQEVVGWATETPVFSTEGRVLGR